MRKLFLLIALFATATLAAVTETESTWDRYSGSSKKGAYPTREACVAAVPVGTTQQCRFRVTVKRTADPVPPPVDSTWVQCAVENETCTFTGTREVRYGTSPTLSGKYAAKTLASPVACSNATFADPTPGLDKFCWNAADGTTPPPVDVCPNIAGDQATVPAGMIKDAAGNCVTAPTPPPSTGSIPTPASIAGKPVVGPIVAVAGQVIENVHVTSTTGACITINVNNVTVRDSEIGPCGQGVNENNIGIRVHNGAANTIIQRNVIHDVSGGVYAAGANGPLVFDRNYVYNVKGPSPRGQMIQFNGFGGAGAKVTCNISDGQPGTRYGVDHGAFHNLEDHINAYGASGSSTAKIEIAYNRLRGHSPTSDSGSGIMVGDGGSSWIWSHDNTLVNTGSTGFAVAGGTNNVQERNRTYMAEMTEEYRPSGNKSIGAYVWAQGGGACTGSVMKDNRLWIKNQNSFWDAGNCSGSTITGNNWNDTTLTAAIFDEAYAACQ